MYMCLYACSPIWIALFSLLAFVSDVPGILFHLNFIYFIFRSSGETILDGHEGSVSGCCFSSDGIINIDHIYL